MIIEEFEEYTGFCLIFKQIKAAISLDTVIPTPLE